MSVEYKRNLPEGDRPPVVIEYVDGEWYAHDHETDIWDAGETRLEALANLEEAITAQERADEIRNGEAETLSRDEFKRRRFG